MTNLLAQAIDCDDADRAAKMIRDALGIESDDAVKYCFPMTWPDDRERRARSKWATPIVSNKSQVTTVGRFAKRFSQFVGYGSRGIWVPMSR